MNDDVPWPEPPAGRNPWANRPGEHPTSDDPQNRPAAETDPDAPDPDHPHRDETHAGQAAPDGGRLPTPPNKWATGAPVAPPAGSLGDYDHPLTPSSASGHHDATATPGAAPGPGEQDLATGPPPWAPGAAEQRPSRYSGGPVDAGGLGGLGGPGASQPPPPPPSGWADRSTPGPGGPAGYGYGAQQPPSQPGGWSGGPGGWGAAPPPPPSPPMGGGGFGHPPPPTSTKKVRVDRAPAWIRGLAGVILFALAGGAAYLLTQGGPSFPSDFDEDVAPLAEWVAAQRGLEFHHAVEVNFLTPEEYTEAITGGESVEMDDEALAELEDSAALLRAMGLLEGEVDLLDATETLIDSGSLAFYSPETKEVYVRGTEITPAMEVTLVHELVHVVQDQHFDLTRVGDLESGDADVLRSLVEGDATRIERRYVFEELSDEEREDYFAESQASADESQTVLDESVPPVLTAMFTAPYMFGPSYVTFLEATGGNDAVDDALENLPIERHLYNPLDIERTGSTGATPTLEAPEGSESMEEGDFGQITWFLLLSARLDPNAAMAATDQIYDDHYVAFRRDDQVCVRLAATTFDDDGMQALVGALGEWKAAAPDQHVDVDAGDGSVVLDACDPGADSGVASDLSVDTLILPVARTQIFAELLDTGLGDDVAECGATRMVEILDVDQLTSEELDPEAQNQVMAAMAGCR